MIFRNGETLNQLAFDMSVVLEERFDKRGFDPSHLSRVINGERLFTPEQLAVFCELQNAIAAEQQELMYVLADERLRSLGLPKGSIQVGAHTIEMTSAGGEKRRLLFLAPPYLSQELVGRDDLLRDLKQRLFSGSSVALTALKGLPGVGKTAVAIALAHDPEVLEHFRDGVLWAGVGRNGDVLWHLGIWAEALGITIAEIAKLTGIKERSMAILNAIGTRRMLLVADDVWEAKAASAFKLTGPNCAYMITTRQREVAMEIVSNSITVVELNEVHGLKLLSSLAPEVAKAEPDELQKLVRELGGLPLAIFLIGKYLRKKAPIERPRRLREALDKLKNSEERLRLSEHQPPAAEHPSLSKGASISLEAVINVSDEALADEEARNALRALSVFPPKPNTFSEDAALAATATPTWVLDKLYDFGLIESSGAQRYAMHQAIADYAGVRLTDWTVYDRVSEFYVHFMDDHQQDYRALNMETYNLLSVSKFFARFPDKARQLTPQVWQQAIHSAIDTGDNEEAARNFEAMGVIALRNKNIDQAKTNFESALSYFKNSKNRRHICALHEYLGGLLIYLGEYALAEDHLRKGLELATELDDSIMIARLHAASGTLEAARGNYPKAIEHALNALNRARQAGNGLSISLIQITIGQLYLIEGSLDSASNAYQEALDILQREYPAEFLDSVAVARYGLARVAAAEGKMDEARRHARESISIYERLGLSKAVEISQWLTTLD